MCSILHPNVRIRTSGGVCSNSPAINKDVAPLAKGYVVLQAESHPTEFRKNEVLDLSGCMDDLNIDIAQQRCPDGIRR
jgi:hypothetical protein